MHCKIVTRIAEQDGQHTTVLISGKLREAALGSLNSSVLIVWPICALQLKGSHAVKHSVTR